jgi:hypothetical protein
MQPTFVVWNDGGGANQPNTGFFFFDQNLPTGKLFAQRNLAVGTDDFDAAGGSEGGHGCSWINC